MGGVVESLARWDLDLGQVRQYIYRADNPRERERWHAIWLYARGWTAAEVGEALERDAHTVGGWVEAFREGGPAAAVFEQSGGRPPRWGQTTGER